MEKKFGKIIIDGKIIDLDKASIEELEELENKLKDDEKKIRETIDKLVEE